MRGYLWNQVYVWLSGCLICQWYSCGAACCSGNPDSFLCFELEEHSSLEHDSFIYLIHRVSYKEYRLGFTICKEGAQYQIINNCLIGCLKLDRKQEAQDKQQYTSRSELKPFESLTARAAKTSIILGTMVPVTVNKLKGN